MEESTEAGTEISSVRSAGSVTPSVRSGAATPPHAWRSDPNHGLRASALTRTCTPPPRPSTAPADGAQLGAQHGAPPLARSKTRRERLGEQKRLEAFIFGGVREAILSESSSVPVARGSTTRLGPAYGTSYYDGVGIVPNNLGSGEGQGVRRVHQPSEVVGRNGVQLRSRGQRGAAFRHVDLFKESAGWAPG